MIEAICVGAVRGGTSMLFAAVGETVTERSGVVNLGVEGSMLAGALAAYAVGIESGSALFGVGAGLLAGMTLALLHGFFVLVRGANQIATGLAITFLGIGSTALFGQRYVSQGVEPLNTVGLPGLSELPFFGPVFFDHDVLTYASFLLLPVSWWGLYRTGVGLKIRAAGERPEVLTALGASATPYRWAAVAIGGALAGVGGAQLATAFARTWSENMVAGRGFIAVALVIFAGWDPRKTVIGAYLFAGAVAFQLELQAQGADVSFFLLDAVPYIVVLLVFAALSRRGRHRAPEALRTVFDADAQIA